jgi:hypothetical protein
MKIGCIPSLFLLKDVRVLDEIFRYQDIESRRSGYDIGLVNAMIGWYGSSARKWVKDRSGYPYIKIDLTGTGVNHTSGPVKEKTLTGNCVLSAV